MAALLRTLAGSGRNVQSTAAARSLSLCPAATRIGRRSIVVRESVRCRSTLWRRQRARRDARGQACRPQPPEPSRLRSSPATER